MSRALFLATLFLATLFLLLGVAVYADQKDDRTTSVKVQEDASNPADAQEALIAQGLQVYKRFYCGVCHAFSVADSKGQFGPPHDGMGVTALARIQEANYRGKATTAAAYLLESIVDPEAYIVPGYAATPHRMPAYAQLTEQELKALVHLLLQQ